MMAVILAGAAGFLAGVLVMLLVSLLRLSRSGGTAGAQAKSRAKEFTQLLVLSDGGLVWATTIGYMILAAYAIYKGYRYPGGGLRRLERREGLPHQKI